MTKRLAHLNAVGNEVIGLRQGDVTLPAVIGLNCACRVSDELKDAVLRRKVDWQFRLF